MSNSRRLPHYRIVRILGIVRELLLNLNQKLFPGPVVLYEQFQSFWLLQPLLIAAELNIAGHLEEKPLNVEELAGKTASQPEPLYRVLRTLASSGIFKELSGRRFRNNSRSRALLEGEGSIRNMIIHHLGRINWSAAGNLLHTVKSGENAFTGLFGIDIYPYLRKNPEELIRFEKSMSDLSALALDPVLSRFNFSKIRTIADIGGGEGFLLVKILEKYVSVKGILYDLPENALKAANLIHTYDLKARMSVQPGSFLEPFHIEADLYLMKNVLHNWDDEHCGIILGNLRKTMIKGSSLLILEMIVPGPNIPSYAKMVDIQMLATMPGGKERTRQEFEILLTDSGFRLQRIIPTIAPLSILQAVGE